MNRKVRISLGSIISTAAVATFLAVSFVAATANATIRRPAPPGGSTAAGPDPSTYNVGYFDVSEPATENGTGAGDNFVHLINPTAANGSLCAMIYVFDDDQEPGECCGCLLTENKLLTLSVANQLTANWEVNGNDFDNGVIKIVSAVPNGGTSAAASGGCDPSIAYTQTPNLLGSILKPQTVVDVTTTLTETPMFEEGAPDATEATNLISECAFFVAHGSGRGTCNCGPEAE
jgi:hypothetical protein